MNVAPKKPLVGLVRVALPPMIALPIPRGLRDARLPVRHACLGRDEAAARLDTLLALRTHGFVAAAVVAADLLLGLGLGSSL